MFLICQFVYYIVIVYIYIFLFLYFFFFNIFVCPTNIVSPNHPNFINHASIVCNYIAILEINRGFFTSRGAYVNCAIIAMLYTHSIGNQP